MNSITLNEFVDKVYCLNLKNRTDRMIHMDDQFSIIGVEYERFDAVNGRDLSEEEITVCHDDFKTKDQARGAQGAIKTHRSVLKDAIDNDYEKIAVFEDDLVFCSDFKDRFEYYVSSVPNDWDIMYLGCHYHACPNP
ncbi:MAG: glycosyltransferase family 25 protein, partial [Candidatus Riesia sp.]|nr:glycosyltransferase family 25 protein [Candidatus Riesia sp.]